MFESLGINTHRRWRYSPLHPTYLLLVATILILQSGNCQGIEEGVAALIGTPERVESAVKQNTVEVPAYVPPRIVDTWPVTPPMIPDQWEPFQVAYLPRLITLFSTECTHYFDWQTLGLMYSFRRSGQPGKIIRLLACTEEDLKSYKGMNLAPTMVVPNWDKNPHTGDWYPAINKPVGVNYWLENSPDAPNVDWVLILDADQLIRRRILPWELGAQIGRPVSAEYGYLIGCDNILGHLHMHNPRHCDKVGGFIGIHIDDLRKLAPAWLSKTEEVRADKDHYATNITGDIFAQGWISEMYGYAFGASEVGLRHIITNNIMLYPGYTPSAYAEPRLLHYGLRIKVLEWQWDKGDYRDHELAFTCGEIFPFPPRAEELPDEMSVLDRRRDLISIETVSVLNRALREFHRKNNCPLGGDRDIGWIDLNSASLNPSGKPWVHLEDANKEEEKGEEKEEEGKQEEEGKKEGQGGEEEEEEQNEEEEKEKGYVQLEDGLRVRASEIADNMDLEMGLFIHVDGQGEEGNGKEVRNAEEGKEMGGVVGRREGETEQQQEGRAVVGGIEETRKNEAQQGVFDGGLGTQVTERRVEAAGGGEGSGTGSKKSSDAAAADGGAAAAGGRGGVGGFGLRGGEVGAMVVGGVTEGGAAVRVGAGAVNSEEIVGLHKEGGSVGGAAVSKIDGDDASAVAKNIGGMARRRWYVEPSLLLGTPWAIGFAVLLFLALLRRRSRRRSSYGWKGWKKDKGSNSMGWDWIRRKKGVASKDVSA